MKKILIGILVILIVVSLFFNFNKKSNSTESLENEVSKNNTFSMIVYLTAEECNSLNGKIQRSDNADRRCIINKNSYIIAESDYFKFEKVTGESYEAICDLLEGKLQSKDQMLVCIDKNGVTYWENSRNKAA